MAGRFINPLGTVTTMQNFVPIVSAKLISSNTSTSFTFTGLPAVQATSLKITNKGTKGAYIAWGNVGSSGATIVAVASSTTTQTTNCDYIAAGSVMVENFQNIVTGTDSITEGVGAVVDTIACIQGSDTTDNATTTLEVTLGYGN